MRTIALLALLALTVTCCLAEPPADKSSLRRATAIRLEGVEGRIDHMAVDGRRQLLYVAALGNNTVEVIDLKAGKQAGRIEGPKKPQGICVVGESGQFVVASGEDGKCRKFDADQKLLGTIDSLDDADNVRYDAQARQVYVGYGEGALAVIDAEKFTKLADIKLAGHPESFQLEAKGKRIFVNVPDAGHVAVVDRATRTVAATWEIKEARANFPMVLDEPNGRLFIGCRKPAKLLVLDTGSGRTVAAIDIAGDTDDVFFDAVSKQIYVSGGEGRVTVISQTNADTYEVAGQVVTAPGARTSFFVAELGMLYVAVPHHGEQKAELRLFATAGQTSSPPKAP